MGKELTSISMARSAASRSLEALVFGSLQVESTVILIFPEIWIEDIIFNHHKPFTYLSGEVCTLCRKDGTL